MDGSISAASRRTRMALAEARVPRYTSYPTAAQFGSMAEADYRAWLHGGVAAADALSLYVHVPFCRALCWYCACHAKPTRSQPRIDTFVAALLAEAELLAGALPPHAGLSHLHFGGGTPSILGAEGLRRVMEVLRRRFGIRQGAELAIELDPRTVGHDLPAALGELGFTRVSLGVQDIAPEVQARIGRLQPPELVADAVERLRAAGIAAVNLDLMYGLPGQTVAHVDSSALFAAALGADRIAVFGYAHVPWMRPHQKLIDATPLPGAAERLLQAEHAGAVLSALGYQALGLDHFARPGDALAVAARQGQLRRNFQGYTTDTAPVLLGLGPSAIGWLPGGFAQNNVDERRYAAAVQARRLPVTRGVAVTAEDRLRAALIERLMCDFALDVDSVVAMGGGAVLQDALARMEPLLHDGLVRLDGARLHVPPAGRRFVRQVAACLDAYLAPAAARHSAAV